MPFKCFTVQGSKGRLLSAASGQEAAHACDSGRYMLNRLTAAVVAPVGCMTQVLASAFSVGLMRPSLLLRKLSRLLVGIRCQSLRDLIRG